MKAKAIKDLCVVFEETFVLEVLDNGRQLFSKASSDSTEEQCANVIQVSTASNWLRPLSPNLL